MQPLNSAALFLLQVVFNLYIIIIIIRMLLQFSNANYHNPVSQFFVKLTKPVANPLRRILPVYKDVDLALLAILIVLSMIQVWIVMWVKSFLTFHVLAIFILGIANIFDQTLNIYFYAILAAAILSWLNTAYSHPVVEILYCLTEPIMRPFRRIIPTIANIDFSPIVVLIVLKLVTIIFVHSLQNLGIGLLM